MFISIVIKPIQNWYAKSERGFVTLLSVLIVGAVGVAIVVSLLLLGLNASRTSFTGQEASEARSFANACAEEALQQIRDLPTFSGIGSLILGQGSCSYSVTNTGGETRTVNASSTVGTVVQKVQVFVSAIDPEITITSWQEVTDF